MSFVPVMWAIMYLLERVLGREIWQYSAPYPYRWMEDDDDDTATGTSHLTSARERPVADAIAEEGARAA
jgi:hypothetical protein